MSLLHKVSLILKISLLTMMQLPHDIHHPLTQFATSAGLFSQEKLIKTTVDMDTVLCVYVKIPPTMIWLPGSEIAKHSGSMLKGSFC